MQRINPAEAGSQAGGQGGDNRVSGPGNVKNLSAKRRNFTYFRFLNQGDSLLAQGYCHEIKLQRIDKFPAFLQQGIQRPS